MTHVLLGVFYIDKDAEGLRVPSLTQGHKTGKQQSQANLNTARTPPLRLDKELGKPGKRSLLPPCGNA